MEVRVRTGRDGEVVVAAADVEALRGRLRGTLLTAESPGYDEVRRIWNAMIDRRPALIVRCAGAADVMQAVRFAAERELLVSVRGGGHNIAGSACCEGGVMIDLAPMRSVRVDPAGRTARVEPGALLGDVDRETQAFGLAVPLGINTTTGVAGLTLGGGFGWLSRRDGLTIDNLLSCDVVTAAGDLVRADSSENADLFWGIRGGGGNFGIVTSFEFVLRPLGPDVLAGAIVHPLEDGAEVLRFWRDFALRAPDQLACWATVRMAPPAPFLAPEHHGKPVVMLLPCWSGDLDEGELALEPARTFGRPLADAVARRNWLTWQGFFDASFGPGAQNYWKSHDFTALHDQVIDATLEAGRHLPDPQCNLPLAQLGGAISRVANDATAYGRRDAEWLINIHARTFDPRKVPEVVAWARDLFRATEPYATGGVYVNFMTEDEAERAPGAFGPNYARLVELKRKWDPTNLFRVNVNIRAVVAA